MKRMTQILSLGLLLSISSIALAGQGHDRNGHDGYYGNSGRQHHNDHRQYSKHGHGNRHYVRNEHHARRHSHHGRYCYDWHPRGYVAPYIHYEYSSPGLVIVYQPSAGFYIHSGH